MTQLSEIYNQRILELSANIAGAQRLADADATATAHSKLCGSTVTVDLRVEGERVEAFGQTVKACLLGQAAASVMGRNIVGTSARELREVGSAMRKMLKAGGPPPTGRWADLAGLQPVKDYKARHASTLLVFDAVEDAIPLLPFPDPHLTLGEVKQLAKGRSPHSLWRRMGALLRTRQLGIRQTCNRRVVGSAAFGCFRSRCSQRFWPGVQRTAKQSEIKRDSHGAIGSGLVADD